MFSVASREKFVLYIYCCDEDILLRSDYEFLHATAKDDEAFQEAVKAYVVLYLVSLCRFQRRDAFKCVIGRFEIPKPKPKPQHYTKQRKNQHSRPSPISEEKAQIMKERAEFFKNCREDSSAGPT